MQCILPQNSTTPERQLSNPFYGKNFLIEDQYKVALHRFKDGAKCVDNFIGQLESYCKIHDRQAEKLKNWSNSFMQDVRLMSEFKTTKSTWMKAIQGMGQVSDESSNFSKEIQKEVINPLKEFKRKTYGESNGYEKKSKEFEKEFSRIQKPWSKLLNELGEHRESLEKSKTKLREANRTYDAVKDDCGADESEKTTAKEALKKRKEKNSKILNSEQETLRKIETTKPEYEKEMKKVLEKILDIEKSRLENFTKALKSLKKVLDTKSYSNFDQISETFDKAIDQQNIDSDIQKWNEDFGTDSSFPWPGVSLDPSK